MHYKILEKGITGGEVVKIQANYYAPKSNLLIPYHVYIKNHLRNSDLWTASRRKTLQADFSFFSCIYHSSI